ncbi:MAG: hypothetical protein IJM72_03960 [Deltaproteobacteria bacterium]|nr:hypothetical protein [Deltaproteobacteria bacterium]
MTLDINNAQFRAFTNFAETVGAKTIVQADSLTGPDGNARSIRAKSGDFVGNIVRLRASREVNDDVRTLFRQTLANMFGDEGKIPQSVRDAMKLEDFGKGKPLTARRILAVKTAVDRYAKAFDEAKTNVGNACSHFGKEAVEETMGKVLSAVIADADATKLVCKYMDRLLVTGESKLRTAEKACEKARAILANVNELRAAAKGDPRAFKAGLDFLDKIGGKALPPGVFTAVFDGVKALSVKALKGLEADCKGFELHEALDVFVKGADSIMRESGAVKALDGAPEKIPFRAFVGMLLASKCGRKDLQSLHNVLHGDTGAKLLRFYKDFSDGAIRFGAGQIDSKTMEAIKRLTPHYAACMQQFGGIIADVLEIDPESYEEIPVLKGAADHDEDDVAYITGDLLENIQKKAE